ncbi:MAG: TonB-dependent siderophore receptor [Oceanipulchritudo sp.]
MKILSLKLSRAALAASLLLGCPFAHAQSQNGPEEEPVFELSPYEVSTSGDVGYLATNSTSGTRTNMLIQNLPQSLLVVPQEILEDLNATTLFEAIEYAGGLTQGSDQDTPNNVYIRGFQTDWPLRNGIKRVGAVLDAANIERVEVVKGPAAILYGQSGLGGVINYITRKPQEKFFGSFTQIVGSHERFRSELDVNVPLTASGKLLSRGIFAFEDADAYFEDYHVNKYFVNPVLELRPTDKLTIRVEYEFFQEEQTAPYSRLPRWQHPSDRTRNGRPYVKDSNWRAEGLDGLVPVDPSFNLSGPQHYRDIDVQTGTSTIEYQFTDNLFFRNVLYAHSSNREQYRVAAGFITRRYAPPLILRDPSFGVVFEQAIDYIQTGPYRPSYAEARNTVNATQNELVWKLERDNWNGQLLFGQEYFKDERTDSSRSLLETVDSPGLLLRFPIEGLSEWPEELAGHADELAIVYPFIPATLEAFDKQDVPEEYFKEQRYNEEENEAFGYYVTGQASFFNERLQLMGGIRYDRFENKNRQAATNSGTPETGYENVDFSDWAYNVSDKVSPQVGFSWQLIDGVRLYSLYSEGIFPNNNVLTEDGVIEPQTSEGVDVGLKFQLWDNLLNATLGVFRVDRTGIPRRPIDDPTAVYFVFGGLERSEGIEFDYVIQPTPGWQIYGGYTYVDATVVSADNESDVGSLLPYVPKHKFSALSKYTFREGRLEGLYLGLGYIYQDQQQGVYGANNATFIVPDWWKIDFLIGWKTVLWGRNVSFDLKVENVTDEAYIANRLQGYGEPRAFDFKVKIDF